MFLPFFILLDFIVSKFDLFIKLISEISLQNKIKSLFFATKSVSLLISINEILFSKKRVFLIIISFDLSVEPLSTIKISICSLEYFFMRDFKLDNNFKLVSGSVNSLRKSLIGGL